MKPYLDYTEMDDLIRGKKWTWDQIAARCHCSKSTVVRRAREIGCQRKRKGRPRHVSEPREPHFNYLAALRAGFPTDKRPLEGLSNYMQGPYGDEAGTFRHGRGGAE
jgi:transposase